MIVLMHFSNPYTRAQIRSGLSNIAIPVGAAVNVVPFPATLEISVVSDSEDDLIEELSIDGFTTVAEVGAFFSSLPVGINSRLRDASYL